MLQRILIDSRRKGKGLAPVAIANDSKILVIPCGGCGSGKSTITAKLFPGFRVSDADSHRERHPLYDPKNPGGPGGSVHRWAVEQSLTEALELIANGLDRLVYDTTGGTVERVALVVAAARAAGYRVVMVRVITPRADAWARNAARARTVPADAFHRTHDKVNKAYTALCALVDSRIVVSSQNLS